MIVEETRVCGVMIFQEAGRGDEKGFCAFAARQFNDLAFFHLEAEF